MKKLFKNLLFMFMAASMVTMGSCSKDDDKDSSASKLNNLTPDEQKENLEDIGSNLLSEVNASDYSTTVQALSDYMEIAPSNSEYSAVSSLKEIISTSDLAEISTMKAEFRSTSGYYTDDYATYTYNSSTYGWDESANSQALVYVYPSNGQTAKMTMTVSSENYSFTEDGETVYVPKSINYTLTLGTATLMSYTGTVSNFDRTNGYIKMTNTLTVNNLTWYANTDVNASSSSFEAGVTKGSTTLISGSTTITGSGMTTGSSVDASTVKTASVNMNLMDKMFFTVACSDVASLSSKMSQIDSNYPEVDTYETVGNTTTYAWYRPENYYKETVAAYNTYLTAYFNFDNSTTQAGTLYFDYQYDVQESSSSYNFDGETYTDIYKNDYSEIIPGIQFLDGSKYKYYDYFNENNFASFFTTLDEFTNEIMGV